MREKGGEHSSARGGTAARGCRRRCCEGKGSSERGKLGALRGPPTSRPTLPLLHGVGGISDGVGAQKGHGRSRCARPCDGGGAEILLRNFKEGMAVQEVQLCQAGSGWLGRDIRTRETPMGVNPTQVFGRYLDLPQIAHREEFRTRHCSLYRAGDGTRRSTPLLFSRKALMKGKSW